MSEFIDANVFLRYLTRDDPAKARQARILFERAERGEYELTTSEAILAEVVYVLSSNSLYGLSRSDVADALRTLFETPAIGIDHKPSILNAIDLYKATSLDFEDCLAIAHAQRETEGRIFSYDRGLGRVSGIVRLEPSFDDDSSEKPD